MSDKAKIAVDAMGGDQAPQMVIEGLAAARVLYPGVRFVIFGDEKVLRPMLASHPELEAASDLVHTDERVTSDCKPSQALRRGRQSSMGLALQAVKDGEADVAISAGNTGALMALAKFILRTMPGIERPALVAPVPTLRGESVMLDLGANVECDTRNLVEFAVMGAAYARTVLGLSRPTVALLNVGVEELKGKETLREAADILKQATHIPMEFVGFTEGDAIGAGAVDVVVADGFTGNIALKTAEGTARFMGELLRRAFGSSLFAKIGYLFARRGLRQLREHLDPNNHNGGVFLGLNGLVVKSHGGASAEGFKTAVVTAIDMVEADLIRLISADLPDVPGHEEEAGAA
ncbi:phosphate acyltransferase PlsX [Pseudokordiimonas caeni]|uniref:phosphate acyltransferase PlsX n=1 Tax=Pseudokordiimonas caeni TaxID=2997908 RepID=UPI002812243E|nr:phosphate acyltransferase PlsX [Pseudokordiimonas caeni]